MNWVEIIVRQSIFIQLINLYAEEVSNKEEEEVSNFMWYFSTLLPTASAFPMVLDLLHREVSLPLWQCAHDARQVQQSHDLFFDRVLVQPLKVQQHWSLSIVFNC